MRAIGCGATDTGRQRTNNEDRMIVDDEFGLYVVCDGMGGHAAGEVAAELATRTVARLVRDERKMVEGAQKGALELAKLRSLICRVVRDAAGAVFKEAIRGQEHSGMGCTMTLLLVAGPRAVIAHVGDTRLYLLRDGAVELLTADHTLVADMVRRGELTPDAAKEHPHANVLTRSIGHQKAVEVDSLILDVHPDDRFLICSDGVSHYLESLGELASILSSEAVETVPEELIELANERGGRDNATAVVVAMDASPEERERVLAVGDEALNNLSALRRVDLFAGATYPGLLRLLGRCEVRICAAGETLVREGDDCDQFCLVVAGHFSLRAAGLEVAELGPGDYIGDTTLLVRRVSTAALECVKAGRVLILTGKGLRELSQRSPRLGVLLMSRLAEKLSRELAAAGLRLDDRPGHAQTEPKRRGFFSFLQPHSKA